MKIKTLRGLIPTAEVVISYGTCAAACDESSLTSEFKAQIEKKLRENIRVEKIN